MGAKSRRKGATGEREWAAVLRKHGLSARRGVQYSGGPGSPDVVHDLVGVHFEVKRVEALRLYKALEQAQADSDAGGTGAIPVVAHRKNGKPWVVIMYAEDWLEDNLLV